MVCAHSSPAGTWPSDPHRRPLFPFPEMRNLGLKSETHFLRSHGTREDAARGTWVCDSQARVQTQSWSTKEPTPCPIADRLPWDDDPRVPDLTPMPPAGDSPDTGVWHLGWTLLDVAVQATVWEHWGLGPRTQAVSLKRLRGQGCLERGHKRLVREPKKRFCLLDLESSARRCCSSWGERQRKVSWGWVFSS